MHDHAQSERDRIDHELRQGAADARKLKYVSRYIAYLAGLPPSSSSNTLSRRVWMLEEVTVPGVGVFLPERGFICEGCNRLGGEHNCYALKDSWGFPLLRCDCSQTSPCGGGNFGRFCEMPRGGLR
jgi:hypothetical protein